MNKIWVTLHLKAHLYALAGLLFTTALWADSSASKITSHYHFTKSNLRLTDHFFNRYAIRQLRSIKIEYFYLIRKIAPRADDLIQLQERLARMYEHGVNLEKRCPQSSQECLPDFNELYRQSKNLDRILLDLQESKLNFSDASNSAEVDILLEIYNNLIDITKSNQQILNTLQLELMLFETPFKIKPVRQVSYQRLLHSMLLLSEINMTALLGKPLRGEFHELWVNYIKKVDQRIVKTRDKEYLINRIENLNFAWNVFHKNLSKVYDQNLDSNSISTLRIMHNRWNSILRVMLR